MPGARRRLGRGLDALLPELQAQEGDAVRLVAVSALDGNPQQPRRTMDPERLQELAASIRAHGVLEPIIVRPNGNRFQVVAGERRLRAAAMAGLTELPAVVREFSDAEVAEVALVENLQREELNAVEEAEAFARLVGEFGLTQEELSDRLGRSRSAVANALRLLQLGPEARAAVVNGQLSAGHARALLAISDPVAQADAVRRVIASGLSVRDTERLVRVSGTTRRPRATVTAAGRDRAEVAAVEERLRVALGTRVHVRGWGTDRGVVEIEFFGADDLERLIEILGPSR